MTKAKLVELLKNNDIVLAIALVVIVGMMILPLPAPVLDVLLTLNLAFSLVILLTCLYTKEPLDFSSFPTILLLATLFRLGLNISTTRLILLDGEAGNVINAFGEFVVGGNYVVGAVIFVILVLVNFMVITGGATRIAEVSARFTLDSLPGKQLSIDADLNAGLINEDEAKIRRRKLEREMDFYGTMDGASKFVKGDATAGIIITVINIVGGIIIGVAMLKMPIQNALGTYTILTIGDGLISQLPALIISLATGLIVSRAGGQDSSLSKDISKELFSDPRVLGVISGLLVGLGLIPGLPTIPFMATGMVSGVVAYYKRLEAKQKEEQAKIEAEQAEKAKKQISKRKKKNTKEEVYEIISVETLEIEVGYRLVPLLNVDMGGDLLERIQQIRKQIALDLGIVLPSIRVRDNLQLPPNSYQIKLKGVGIEGGEIFPDKSLAMNSSGLPDSPNLSGISAKEPAFGLPALWIEEKDKDFAEAYGYTVVSPSAVVSTHLTEVIKKNAADILSRSDVQQLINNLKNEVSEAYVDDVMKDITVSDVQQVLQNLLRERVPVRDLKTILETISLYIKRVNGRIDATTEMVRQALARVICKQNLADTGELLALSLHPEVEETIAKGISPDGNSLTLSPDFSRALINSINTELEKAIIQTGAQPVILCSAPIRLAFRQLIERQFPSIAVISFMEISTNTKAKSIGIINVASKV